MFPALFMALAARLWARRLRGRSRQSGAKAHTAIFTRAAMGLWSISPMPPLWANISVLTAHGKSSSGLRPDGSRAGALRWMARHGQTIFGQGAWSVGQRNLKGVLSGGQHSVYARMVSPKGGEWQNVAWPEAGWDACWQTLTAKPQMSMQGQHTSQAAPQDWSSPWPGKAWLDHPWRCDGRIAGHDVKSFASIECLGVLPAKPAVGPPAGIPGQNHGVMADAPDFAPLMRVMASSVTFAGKLDTETKGASVHAAALMQAAPPVDAGPGSFSFGATRLGFVDTDSNASMIPWPDTVWTDEPWAKNLGIASGNFTFAGQSRAAATGVHHLEPVWQNCLWERYDGEWWYPAFSS